MRRPRSFSFLPRAGVGLDPRVKRKRALAGVRICASAFDFDSQQWDDALPAQPAQRIFRDRRLETHAYDEKCARRWVTTWIQLDGCMPGTRKPNLRLFFFFFRRHHRFANLSNYGGGGGGRHLQRPLLRSFRQFSKQFKGVMQDYPRIAGARPRRFPSLTWRAESCTPSRFCI